MALKVNKVDVWAGDLPDQPGGLSRVLRSVSDAGGDVECVIARRKDNRPGAGTVFVTPVQGQRAQDGARGAGLSPASNIGTLRIEGADRAGLGQRITQAVGDAGINMRGLTAAVVGTRFVAYLGFDSPADADRAATAIRGVSDAGSGARRAASRSSGGAKKKKKAGGARRTTTKKRARAKR
jgi:hypothetical protein